MKTLLAFITMTLIVFAVMLSMNKEDNKETDIKGNCYEWHKLSKENKIKLTAVEVKTGKKLICEEK